MSESADSLRAENHPMTITCPHCATQYQLPPSLMGPGGARVRCPKCQGSFVVSAAGEVTTVPPARAPESVAPVPEMVAQMSERLARVSEAVPAPPAPVSPPNAVPAPGDAAASSPPVAGIAAPDDESPEAVARRLLEEMDTEHGPREIAFAAQQGTLFFAHGPRLMEAWDAYRRIVGRNASAAVFRDALRERWGVDLTPADALPR